MFIVVLNNVYQIADNIYPLYKGISLKYITNTLDIGDIVASISQRPEFQIPISYNHGAGEIRWSRNESP